MLLLVVPTLRVQLIVNIEWLTVENVGIRVTRAKISASFDGQWRGITSLFDASLLPLPFNLTCGRLRRPSLTIGFWARTRSHPPSSTSDLWVSKLRKRRKGRGCC